MNAQQFGRLVAAAENIIHSELDPPGLGPMWGPGGLWICIGYPPLWCSAAVASGVARFLDVVASAEPPYGKLCAFSRNSKNAQRKKEGGGEQAQRGEGGKGTSSLLPRGPDPSPRNKESPGRKRGERGDGYFHSSPTSVCRLVSRQSRAPCAGRSARWLERERESNKQSVWAAPHLYVRTHIYTAGTMLLSSLAPSVSANAPKGTQEKTTMAGSGLLKSVFSRSPHGRPPRETDHAM